MTKSSLVIFFLWVLLYRSFWRVKEPNRIAGLIKSCTQLLLFPEWLSPGPKLGLSLHSLIFKQMFGLIMLQRESSLKTSGLGEDCSTFFIVNSIVIQFLNTQAGVEGTALLKRVVPKARARPAWSFLFLRGVVSVLCHILGLRFA